MRWSEMMNPVRYNLDIGAMPFERLCQVLARYVIGPTVQVTGAGPDKGWDAEFEGPVDYPWSEAGEKWDGFGVLIVKYKSDSSHTAGNNAWFKRAVRQSLERLAKSSADTARAGRRPEYIVFATNIPLTVNAIDSADELFSSFAARLGLKGWTIWHHDAISRYIDSFPDVRYGFILGHDYIPYSYEPVAIGDLSRLRLTPLGKRPLGCPEIVPAWWRLISTHESIAGLFSTQQAIPRAPAHEADVSNESGLPDSAQDLLRAAIVFTSAGLDACLEVLLSHAIPVLIACNENARRKFELYIENQANAPRATQDFLGAVKDLDPRGRLLELYIRSLTSGSFQGSKSIKDRCVAALGIANEQLPSSRLAALDGFFRARNDVAHRLDLMQPAKDDVKPDRQPRRPDDVRRMCDDALILIRDLIEVVARNLDDSRRGGPSDE